MGKSLACYSKKGAHDENSDEGKRQTPNRGASAMSSTLKQFCYTASQRVMTGLAQELQIYPNIHYRPAGYNTARVLSLRLVGVNPHFLPKIRGMQLPLTM
jgi:hypothetical protein